MERLRLKIHYYYLSTEFIYTPYRTNVKLEVSSAHSNEQSQTSKKKTLKG